MGPSTRNYETWALDELCDGQIGAMAQAGCVTFLGLTCYKLHEGLDRLTFKLHPSSAIYGILKTQRGLTCLPLKSPTSSSLLRSASLTIEMAN